VGEEVSLRVDVVNNVDVVGWVCADEVVMEVPEVLHSNPTSSADVTFGGTDIELNKAFQPHDIFDPADCKLIHVLLLIKNVFESILVTVPW
jgi:ABC-type thiamine transport system substrate-binding protein